MKDPFDKNGAARMLDDTQLAYLGGWLRRNADALGLADWVVKASPFAAAAGNIATSYISDQIDRITVSVGAEFLNDETPDEQRESLAHELLHPHFHRVTRCAERLIDGELGKRTEAIIEDALKVYEELALDRLARSIAKWLEPFELPRGEAA